MKTCLIAAAALAVSAGLASAGTIDVRFTGTGAGQTIHVNSPSLNGNVFAGQLFHTLSNATGPEAQFNGDYVTFCTDLSQHVTSTIRTYDLVAIDLMPNSTPMGAAKAQALTKLYASAGGSQLLGGTSSELGAAFQIAVWEIISDYNPSLIGGGLDVTAGTFRATKTDGSTLSSSVRGHLTSLFAAANTEGGVGAGIMGIRSSTAQDQIIPVPTPGAFALAGLGGLCLVRRRRTA